MEPFTNVHNRIADMSGIFYMSRRLVSVSLWIIDLKQNFICLGVSIYIESIGKKQNRGQLVYTRVIYVLVILKVLFEFRAKGSRGPIANHSKK